MTAKQIYNEYVRECRQNTCSTCGCVRFCNLLEANNIEMAQCREYFQLKPDEKIIVQNIVKEYLQ